MSENPRDGVVNNFGQTHDIPNLFISDGSQFTTGGAENPTLTIVTLAIRQADIIADMMARTPFSGIGSCASSEVWSDLAFVLFRIS